MVDPKQVTVDSALSTLSQQFKNAALIGEQVAKVVPVAKESGKYFIYGKEAFKLVSTLRMDGTQSNEIHQKLSLGSYSCEEHSLSDIVTDRVRKNADLPINPDLDTTDLLTNLILLRLEYEIAAKMVATANYTNSNYSTLSGTTQWSDYTNSTPLTNIKSAKAVVRKLIGMEANSIILGGDVAETLSLHPDIKELRKYTDPNLLTDAGLPPKILGLKVLEGKATQDIAYEGQTSVMSYIWGKHAIIAYIPDRVGVKSLAPWVTMRVTGYRETRKWREEKRKGDMIEVSDMFDVREIADECAYLYAAAIA